MDQRSADRNRQSNGSSQSPGGRGANRDNERLVRITELLQETIAAVRNAELQGEENLNIIQQRNQELREGPHQLFDRNAAAGNERSSSVNNSNDSSTSGHRSSTSTTSSSSSLSDPSVSDGRGQSHNRELELNLLEVLEGRQTACDAGIAEVDELVAKLLNDV